jgi:hypothetical protein
MPSIQARVRIVTPDKETLNDETGLVVKGSDIINQMRINNVWKNDREGKYAGLMFDGQTYKFRIGQELIVPVHVARYLRRMSAICVGSDKLNGPLMPFVEIVDDNLRGLRRRPTDVPGPDASPDEGARGPLQREERSEAPD